MYVKAVSVKLYQSFSMLRPSQSTSELFITSWEMKQGSFGSLHFRQALVLQKKKYHFVGRPNRGIKKLNSRQGISPPHRKMWFSSQLTMLHYVTPMFRHFPFTMGFVPAISLALGKGYPPIPKCALGIHRANVEF